jgi:hypothetical protein
VFEGLGNLVLSDPTQVADAPFELLKCQLGGLAGAASFFAFSRLGGVLGRGHCSKSFRQTGVLARSAWVHVQRVPVVAFARSHGDNTRTNRCVGEANDRGSRILCVRDLTAALRAGFLSETRRAARNR